MFCRLSIPTSLLSLMFLVGHCHGQEPSLDLRRDQGPRNASTTDASLGVVTPTPEMWFYEQERNRLDDPKMTIRRRAELRATQRQDRLAALAWYGISNSRPTVSLSPWYGGYSAHWSANSYDPLRWRAMPSPVVVMRPTAGPY